MAEIDENRSRGEKIENEEYLENDKKTFIENEREKKILDKEPTVKIEFTEVNILQKNQNSEEDEKLLVTQKERKVNSKHNENFKFGENSKFGENEKIIFQKRKISSKGKPKFEENSKKLESHKRKVSLEENFNVKENNANFEENLKFGNKKKFDENTNSEKLEFEEKENFLKFEEDLKFQENGKAVELEIYENPKFVKKSKIQEGQNSNFQKRKISAKENSKFEENSKFPKAENANFQKRKISSNQKPKFEETKKLDTQKRKVSMTKMEKSDKNGEKIEDNIFLDENYCFRNRGRRKIKDSIREKLALDLRDAIHNKFTLPVKKPSKKKSRDESRISQTEETKTENVICCSSPEKMFERPSEYQEILIDDQTIDPQRKNTPCLKFDINSPTSEIIKMKNRRRSVENSETISSAAKRRPSLDNRKFSTEKNLHTEQKVEIEKTENFPNKNQSEIIDSTENKAETKILNPTFEISNKFSDSSDELKINLKIDDKFLELKKPLKSTELVKQITSKNEAIKINKIEDEVNKFQEKNPSHKIVKKHEAILESFDNIENDEEIENKNMKVEAKMLQVEKKRKEIENKMMEIEAKEREVEEKQREFEIRKLEVESKMREIENHLLRIERENSKIDLKKNPLRTAGRRKNWDTVEKLANIQRSTIANLSKFTKSANKESINKKISKIENIENFPKTMGIKGTEPKEKDHKEIKIEKCRKEPKKLSIVKILKSNSENENEKKVQLTRTDSVESALKHFDSFETDEELTTSKESMKNKIPNSKEIKNSTKIVQRKNSKSLNVKILRNPQSKKIVSREKNSPPLSKSSITISKTPMQKETKNNCASQKLRKSRRRDSEDGKNFDYSRISAARDSIELARNFIRNRSPSCKRKLFQDSEVEMRKIWKLSSQEKQLLTKKYQENDEELNTSIDNEKIDLIFSKQSQEHNEEIIQSTAEVKEGKFNEEFMSNDENNHKEIKNCRASMLRQETKSQSSMKQLKESRVIVSANFVKTNGKFENLIVSRNARSPSPNFDERKQVENSKTTTRRNNSGSPLKSPDNGLKVSGLLFLFGIYFMYFYQMFLVRIKCRHF